MASALDKDRHQRRVQSHLVAPAVANAESGGGALLVARDPARNLAATEI